MTTSRKKEVLLLYVIVFYGIWAAYEFAGKAALAAVLPDEILNQLVSSGVIKNVVWTVPAILLVRHFESEMNITLREMFTSKFSWLPYLPLFALFTAYILGFSALRRGGLFISAGFGWEKLIIVLFVGLTEEMVFRGWLLNAMMKEDKKRSGMIVNALMFLVIHFPSWISKGIFINTFISLGFLCIVILSVIFSLSFVKSRSIFPPIALHMYWDLLMFMFF